MPNTVVGINSELLRWAREQASLSLEEVAGRLKKEAADIESWEEGESAPTYVQLERLAYKIYRRPMALFFLPEPPLEPEPESEFRTLPKAEIRGISTDSRLAIREALARQLSLREICGNHNPSDRLLFRAVPVSVGEDHARATRRVREYLGITIEDQVGWRSPREAFRQWRNALEEVGVFVFKRSLKQREISGFCLADNEFPLIYINNSTPKTRQVFSLIHELVHVLLSTSGITFRDDRFIETLVGRARELEIFCNRFAAEALVPSEDFEQFRHTRAWTDEVVEAIAGRYSVSREVILRRVLDWGFVSREYYKRKARVNRPGFSGGFFT